MIWLDFLLSHFHASFMSAVRHLAECNKMVIWKKNHNLDCHLFYVFDSFPFVNKWIDRNSFGFGIAYIQQIILNNDNSTEGNFSGYFFSAPVNKPVFSIYSRHEVFALMRCRIRFPSLL